MAEGSVEHADPLVCIHEQQQLMMSQYNMQWPIRLIDVAATLASGRGVVFAVKSDWDFHVISHTWSLSIRDLSEEVGRSLSDQISSQEYNDAFARWDFSQQSGYQDLLAFLELLMGDGVQHAWFDALCINQTDDAEKSREIRYMGAYYRYSAGCYVVNHGIGMGYDLLGWDEKRGEVCTPRWFTRVWTLQEFLLPTKLIFLVSNLKKHVVLPLNDHIRKHSGSGGLRRCCDSQSLEARWYKCCESPAYCRCQNSEEAADDDHITPEILCAPADELCSRCNSPPFIWKARGCKGQPVYFVDRLYYRLLISMDQGPHCFVTTNVPPQVVPATKHIRVKAWQMQLVRLYKLLGSKCYACSLAGEVAYLIKFRNCSQNHDEDRVLSILSLMGLEGRMQVRTNTTLEKQWVEVARALVKEQHLKLQLLNLCIGDFRMSFTDGASWIPDYRSFPFDFGVSINRVFYLTLSKALVEAEEVTQEGGIRLRGEVVPALLFRDPNVPWEFHANSAGTGCCRCLRFCPVHGQGRLHQQGSYHLEVPGNLCIPLTVDVFTEYIPVVATSDIAVVPENSDGCYIQQRILNSDEHCPDCAQVGNGSLFLPLKCMHILVPHRVYLVLWGASLARTQSTMIAMVCVGEIGLGPRRQLHKIGVLQFSPDVGDAIFSGDTAIGAEFVLGGFGKYVADSWISTAERCGVRCHMYPRNSSR